jgi:hypothetical protein
MKKFELRWARTREGWNDEVRRAFDEQYIAPLTPRVKGALDAMERAAEAIAQARRECE